MAIIILAAFFSTLVLAFAGTGRYGLRQSLVYAATVYTLCLVLATEALSIWYMLRFGTLLAFWTGLTIVSSLYLRFFGNRQAVLQTLKGALTQFRASRALWAVALVWSVILAIALVYPPNNWDSMTYHMARIPPWIRQGSINFFPTETLLQLHQPPLAEWNILHFQILSGGDRFANMVQWASLVGCSIVASLIASELKQSFPVQVLALVIAATLPMGLLQGSSTQNDLVVSFWLLVFVLFSLQYIHKPVVKRMSLCGLALGFALLTKGTAYAFAPPLTAMLLVYGITHTQGGRPRVKLVSAAVAILALALLLNSSHWARNWEVFGHPFPPSNPRDFNADVSVSVVWSNLVRHAALHLGTPSDRINAIIFDIIRGIMGGLIDIPEATWPNQSLRITLSKNEDLAGNFLHFWVLSASLLGAILIRRYSQFGTPTIYLALAIVLGMILYSILLRWDPWASRRHTTLFMLGAPIMAIFTSRLGIRTGDHFTTIFLVMSVPWIFFNETRPIYSDDGKSIFSMDRIEAYFYPVPEIFQSYVDAVEYLREQRAKEIGIDSSIYEYPIRVLLEENLDTPRIEHFNPGISLAKLRDDKYMPQYILSTRKVIRGIDDASYLIVWISPEVVVAAREDIAGGLINQMFEGYELIVESNYDVYVREGIILYVNGPCEQSDIDLRIFLHVYPVDVDDLSNHRRQQGFSNRDFRLEEHGWRSGDRCLAARRLPTYAIRHIETGQYGPDGGRLWSGSFSFDGKPKSG